MLILANIIRSILNHACSLKLQANENVYKYIQLFQARMDECKDGRQVDTIVDNNWLDEGFRALKVMGTTAAPYKITCSETRVCSRRLAALRTQASASFTVKRDAVVGLSETERNKTTTGISDQCTGVYYGAVNKYLFPRKEPNERLS